MRWTQTLIPTLRETPQDAEIESHKWMLRAGLIRKLAGGLYTFLPVGLRALRNVERVIREEMDRAGALEVLMPALQPREIWEVTGRYETLRKVMFRVRDRADRELVLGPTHEEVITDLVSRELNSYRQLPRTFYQIQTKYRDEIRPRFGLMRAREFFMKDAYSFDPDWESLDQSYQDAFDAYVRIFKRAGVPVIPVDADSGAIGGKDSQEFVFLTEVGEDEILLCPGCGYAANAEKAEFVKPPAIDGNPLPMEEVATPGIKTIADLAQFLGIEARQTVKAVFYEVDGKPVFVSIRGDLDVNEAKLRNALKATDVEPMDDGAVRRHGLIAGSASAVGLSGMLIVADDSAVDAANLVGGANKPDAHLLNTNHGRDWKADIVANVALARAGDQCPKCEGLLEVQRGIEMGHVFKLGTIYSEAIGVYYLDESGQRQLAVMGCYGIGVERMLAAVIEANHDDNGIIWPAEVAPFDVHVVVIGGDDAEVAGAVQAVESTIETAGLSVLLDDRDDSPGIKFKDADLLGMPVRITVSPRALKNGGVEFKLRSGGEATVVPLDGVLAEVRKGLSSPAT